MISVEDKAAEVPEARALARELLARGYSRDEAVKQMHGAFHVCIYATQTGIWASYLIRDGVETKKRLA